MPEDIKKAIERVKELRTKMVVKCQDYLKDLDKALREEIEVGETKIETAHDVHAYFKRMGFYVHVQTYPGFCDDKTVTLAAYLTTEPSDRHEAQVGWVLGQSQYRWQELKKVSKDLADELWKQYPSLRGRRNDI